MASTKAIPLLILSLFVLALATKITTPVNAIHDDDEPQQHPEAEHANFNDYKASKNHDAPDPATLDEKDVVVLSQANFSEFLDKTEYVMVQFYAPWCQYCKSLAPEYTAAATAIKEAGFSVVLAKVDAIVETKIADQFKVDGFPAIYFFDRGQHTPYEGERTKGAIVSWLKKKTGFSVQNVACTEEAAKILANEPKIVVAFVDSLTDSDNEELNAAAKVEDYVSFYQTTNPDVAKIFDINPKAKRPTLILLKNEVEKRSIFDGNFSRSAIINFVSTNKHPLVINFSRDTVEVIFDDPLKKQILLFAPEKDSSKLLNLFQETAKAFKGKLIFVYVDTDNEDYGKAMVDHFGIVGDTTRVVAYGGHSDGRKFLMDHDITLENTKLFAENFLADKLQTFYKSDPIPEINEGDVKVVVGKNFESIVFDESKDVLLQIYASWCPHCRAMEAAYNELATHMRGIKSIIIAKMDGTRNEHPKAKFDGYPAILFFPAGTKKSSDPIVVDVDRTDVELYKFLKKHAGTSFTIPELDEKSDEEKTLEIVKDEL